MVKRVIQMVYKEVRGLHQAAYVLALFAFGSQILALVRDRLLAHQFGAGADLDIYYTAFRIPDLLYVLFASTLSVYVLIPFVVARVNGEDARKAQDLLSQVFSIFLVSYIGLALIVVISAPYLVPFLFPGLSGESELLVTLMRILMLQPLLLGISSLFGVVTQLGHRFVLYAISPLIYNVGIIFGIVTLYPRMGLSGLAWGVVLGALGHMLVQLPLVRKSPLAFSVTSVWNGPLIREVLTVSIPRATTLAMHQVVLLVMVSIASLMAVGSVSVFQFAYNLQSVPLAVIGASYSIAAFPYLAEKFAEQNMQAFRLHITSALRHIIFWSVPAIALIIVLRAQMVRVVLGSGSFDWGDTRLTAAVLALLAISLVAQAINLLVVRAFYAGGYTRTPFLITLGGSVFAVTFVYALYVLYPSVAEDMPFLVALMRLDGVPGAEVILIGFGYSVAILLQTLVLGYCMAKRFEIDMSWLAMHLGRSLLAGLVGALTAYATLNFFISGINPGAFLGIFIQGLLGGVAGIVGATLTYYILRSPELSEIYRAFHSRVFKTDVVAPQEDVL